MDRHPKTRRKRKQIWERNLVRMANLPWLSKLIDLPITYVSAAVEEDIQQRIVLKLRRVKEVTQSDGKPAEDAKNRQQHFGTRMDFRLR